MLTENIKLLFLVLFLVGLTSVFGFRIWQVKRAKSVPFSPQESSFSLKPPSEALVGRLTEVEGDVKKESRNDGEFKEVKEKEQILDGEKLATGGKSQASVELPGFAKVTLDSNSEVGFVSLLPSSFLIKQARGVVGYRLLQNENSLSIRSLHLLLTLDSGESKVETSAEDGEIIVKQLAGKAKLALVDLENKTHVWQLEERQTALINDAERTVEIGGL